MDQKLLFIADYKRPAFSSAELCRRFGISRKTGYKWVYRFEGGGVLALDECIRRPHRYPHQTEEAVVEAVINARNRHPTLGVKSSC